MPFTEEDWKVIKAAVAQGGDIWQNKSLNDIKQKIKSYYRNKTGGHCCYCRARFAGEFKMVIDIEHVLPKSKFMEFIFEMFNLNLSCKRCNMLIKGERLDFIVDVPTIHLQPKDSARYFFIHPNLDEYFDHMDYDVNIKNKVEMVKYTPKKPKGNFTYKFFRLDEKEIELLNEAQGVTDTVTEEVLPGQSKDIQVAATLLINQV